jgi:hypothetical protein
MSPLEEDDGSKSSKNKHILRWLFRLVILAVAVVALIFAIIAYCRVPVVATLAPEPAPEPEPEPAPAPVPTPVAPTHEISSMNGTLLFEGCEELFSVPYEATKVGRLVCLHIPWAICVSDENPLLTAVLPAAFEPGAGGNQPNKAPYVVVDALITVGMEEEKLGAVAINWNPPASLPEIQFGASFNFDTVDSSVIPDDGTDFGWFSDITLCYMTNNTIALVSE